MIRQGHVLDELAKLDAESVQCVVTSPPYWGLRDYKLPDVEWPDGWRGCLGLEPTPKLFVEHIVEVFRAVRRVLRGDGTVFLNLGDGYLNKNLLGMPWRVALALQADGWFLRSEIIWAKPNPMPESVRDRPTRAHEQIFLLTRLGRYFYDAVGAAEKATGLPSGNTKTVLAHERGRPGCHLAVSIPHEGVTARNARTVWAIPPQAYGEAHFATFPEALVERCLLAGTSPYGACHQCGTPWERVTERRRVATRPDEDTKVEGRDGAEVGNRDPQRHVTEDVTVSWRLPCEHGPAEFEKPPRMLCRPCVVLDPFAGSGTTLLVARRMGHTGIGIELSGEYVAMARRRLEAVSLLTAAEAKP